MFDFNIQRVAWIVRSLVPCGGGPILVSAAAIAFSPVAQAAVAEPTIEITPGVTFVQRDSGPLKADLYVPKGAGPFPAVLVIHGGGWMMGTREQLAGAAVYLAEHGYTAVTIEYRLAPQDKWPAQIYDCAAAVRWMRAHASEYKIDPTRIGAYGYSAGGHLAALLGVLKDDELREPGVAADAPSARVNVVLAGGAPCDFRAIPPDNDRLAYWLGGTPADKPDAYRDASPINYVTADDPPMYFFHGDSDELVPIRSPEKMVEKLRSAGVATDFYEVKGAGHIPAAMDKEALARAMAFADHVLKGEPLKTETANTGTENGTARASDDASHASSSQGVSAHGQ
jgi:acetyl esterase/lipase